MCGERAMNHPVSACVGMAGEFIADRFSWNILLDPTATLSSLTFACPSSPLSIAAHEYLKESELNSWWNWRMRLNSRRGETTMHFKWSLLLYVSWNSKHSFAHDIEFVGFWIMFPGFWSDPIVARSLRVCFGNSEWHKHLNYHICRRAKKSSAILTVFLWWACVRSIWRDEHLTKCSKCDNRFAFVALYYLHVRGACVLYYVHERGHGVRLPPWGASSSFSLATPLDLIYKHVERFQLQRSPIRDCDVSKSYLTVTTSFKACNPCMLEIYERDIRGRDRAR